MTASQGIKPIITGPKKRIFKVTATVETIMEDSDLTSEISNAKCINSFRRRTIGGDMIASEAVEMTTDEVAQYYADKRAAAKKAAEPQEEVKEEPKEEAELEPTTETKTNETTNQEEDSNE